jgi:hypothetical protein
MFCAMNDSDPITRLNAALEGNFFDELREGVPN